MMLISVAATVTTVLVVDRFVEVRTQAQVTSQIRQDLQTFAQTFTEAETRQRGYLLTGDEAYLVPYRQAAESLPGRLDQLVALAKGTAVAGQIGSLRAPLTDKLGELADTVSLRQTQGQDAALQLVASGRGQRDTDQLRGLIARIDANEATVLDQQRQAVSVLATRVRYISLISLGLVIGLAALVYYLFVRAIEAERRLDRAKDEFVALASHQLRTPATGIKSILSMLSQGDFGSLSDKQRHVIGRAIESNQRELGIIEELLNVAKADAGRLVLRPAEVDLRQLVNTIVAEQRAAIELKGLELRIKQPDRPITLVGDEEKLYMAIGNLVDNARKYTAEEGVITVIIHGRRGTAAVEVVDTGVGIEEADIAHVFDRFQRAHSVLSGNIEGTGLGLYLARRIVELHNGTIEVDSKKGRGSRFVMTLPLRRA